MKNPNIIKAKEIVDSLIKKVHLGVITTRTNQDTELINQLNNLNKILNETTRLLRYKNEDDSDLFLK